ncbi:MAG: formyltransferase family protein [Chitinophagaceae bacterium]
MNFSLEALLTQSRIEFQDENNLEQLAKEWNIPVFTSLEEIPECDILYSVQYHQILLQSHIDKAKQIALNLHMAPLPEYRGCNQFSFAIIDNKKEFGTTIHQMDARIDHGDILFEKRFPIPENCWVERLYKTTEAASAALFKESLNDILNGKYFGILQKNLEDVRGSSIHYRDDIQALRRIDLSWPEEKISRHIRATSMPGFEPPFTMIGNDKIYLTRQR